MSTAEESWRFCGLFEAELLLELMLRYWRHPLADKKEYRNELIESATEVLEASVGGTRLMEDVPPEQMNFVAAVWYAEWAGLQAAASEIAPRERKAREKWLNVLRRAVPSCFCDQNDLG
jgi:hypothetical protein